MRGLGPRIFAVRSVPGVTHSARGVIASVAKQSRCSCLRRSRLDCHGPAALAMTDEGAGRAVLAMTNEGPSQVVLAVRSVPGVTHSARGVIASAAKQSKRFCLRRSRLNCHGPAALAMTDEGAGRAVLAMTNEGPSRVVLAVRSVPGVTHSVRGVIASAAKQSRRFCLRRRRLDCHGPTALAMTNEGAGRAVLAMTNEGAGHDR